MLFIIFLILLFAYSFANLFAIAFNSILTQNSSKFNKMMHYLSYTFILLYIIVMIFSIYLISNTIKYKRKIIKDKDALKTSKF